MLERLGDAIQDLLVDLHVLTGRLQPDDLAGPKCHVAHDPREGREGAPDRHHRQAHRPVPDLRHAASVVLDELPQTPHSRRHLRAGADQAVQREGDIGRQRRRRAQTGLAQRLRPTGLLGGEAQQVTGGLLDAARAEVGLADDVQQLVHLVGGDPHRVAAGSDDV